LVVEDGAGTQLSAATRLIQFAVRVVELHPHLVFALVEVKVDPVIRVVALDLELARVLSVLVELGALRATVTCPITVTIASENVGLSVEKPVARSWGR
jgi:hypothetical protein